MRCNPVKPEHIKRAKSENLYIVQVCITGQYRNPRDGGTAITGAFSKESAQELLDFIREWYAKQD
jgi:hypothetical protein